MIRPQLLTAITVTLILMCSPLAWSQTDQPATSPTSAPVRYQMTAPPGMQVVQVGDYTGVCMPQYGNAVQSGLQSIKPVDRPSTMPSDLVTHLAAGRDQLIKDMTSDLGLSDPSVAADYLDGTIAGGLKKMADISPHLFVIVGTQDDLRTAIQGGWNAPPNFHFNPQNNHVDYVDREVFPTDREPDDTVFWVEIEPAMTPANISDQIVQRVQGFTQLVTKGLSNAGPQYIVNLMVAFVRKQAIDPLKLPGSETWFGVGVMGELAAKYAAEIDGASRADMTDAADRDSGQNPIRVDFVDLYQPLDMKTDIKPEYLGIYQDAMVRKAIRVIDYLVSKTSDQSIPRMLSAIKDGTPPDNASLVTLILTTTGIDLTNQLKPSGT